jgi:alkanesulfonate monooxygenase SsuD/methylene tetrahydromethanopterin reductase-like flavin-dependent oxidoreductase (luciferase family)
MLSGRFFLGVGTGENLNEHILGDAWPHAARRGRMLEESIELMRELWTGELVSPRRRVLPGRDRPSVFDPGRAADGQRGGEWPGRRGDRREARARAHLCRAGLGGRLGLSWCGRRGQADARRDFYRPHEGGAEGGGCRKRGRKPQPGSPNEPRSVYRATEGGRERLCGRRWPKGQIQVHQVLAVRSDGGYSGLPLHRAAAFRPEEVFSSG